MIGEPDENAGGEEAAETEDAWQDVGKQFQKLGESLSSDSQRAWENEDNRRTLHNLSEGLKTLANDVGQALDDAAASDEGQRMRQEVEKAAKSASEVGAEACRDVRPHVVSVLNRASTELQKLIGNLEAESGTDEPSES